MKCDPAVFVVDDDPAIRESLNCLFVIHGQNFEMYSSADEFLETFDPQRPGCLVLDLRMPGMNGLELQQHLLERGVRLPIIMLTAHGDVRTAVASLKSGAVDFVQKPFDPNELLEKIREALERDTQIRQEQAYKSELADHLKSLTSREREIVELIVEGNPSKTIARKLGISINTVRNHRTAILRKTKADSVVDLVRMVTSLRSSSGWWSFVAPQPRG